MSAADTKKLDWHLLIATISVILTISIVVISCYVNLRNDLTTIKTVLILKGIMPETMANQEKK